LIRGLGLVPDKLIVFATQYRIEVLLVFYKPLNENSVNAFVYLR